MNDLSKMTSEVVSPTDTISRLTAPRIFASEKAEDYAGLRAAMFAELAPRTAYETSLAENLVRYEWEMARLQRFRDTAILAEFRNLALRALLTGDPTGYVRAEDVKDDDRALVRDLVSPDLKLRFKAEEEFREGSDWDSADLFGLAYARASGVTKMEDRIADLERRRRILRADYADLKTASTYSAADDAEILESVVGQ
jgi:hypothetical protein